VSSGGREYRRNPRKATGVRAGGWHVRCNGRYRRTDEAKNFHHPIVEASFLADMKSKVVEAKNADGIKTRRVDPAR